jgi:hypothetical protein
MRSPAVSSWSTRVAPRFYLHLSRSRSIGGINELFEGHVRRQIITGSCLFSNLLSALQEGESRVYAVLRRTTQ